MAVRNKSSNFLARTKPHGIDYGSISSAQFIFLSGLLFFSMELLYWMNVAQYPQRMSYPRRAA